MKFSPEQMRDWESTKPWNLSLQDAQSQSVPGWWGKSARGSESASWEQGYIRPSPEFYALPESARRAIAYHEAGHAMIEAAGGLSAVSRYLDIDVMEITDWVGASTLGYNAEEVIAESYSVLWTEPSWFSGKDARLPKIAIDVAELARYPLPSAAHVGSKLEDELENLLKIIDAAPSKAYHLWSNPPAPKADPDWAQILRSHRTLFRGMGVAVTPEEQEALLDDKVSRQHQISVLMAAVHRQQARYGGGVGLHWSTTRNEAAGYAASSARPNEMRVIIEVHSPDPAAIQTPEERKGQAVWHYDVEQEVPIRPGTRLEMVSVEWAKGGVSVVLKSDDGGGWRSIYDPGISVTASQPGDERPYREYMMRYRTMDNGERKLRQIIETFDGDTKIGELNWYGTTGVIHHLLVEDGYYRQGIATAMWEWGKEMRPRPRHSEDQTTQGKAWARAVGASVTAVQGNLYRGLTTDVSPEVAGRFLTALNAGNKLEAGRIITDWISGPQGGYNDGNIGRWWAREYAKDQLWYYAEGGCLWSADGKTFAFESGRKARVGVMLKGQCSADYEIGGNIFPEGTPIEVVSVEMCVKMPDEYGNYNWFELPVGQQHIAMHECHRLYKPASASDYGISHRPTEDGPPCNDLLSQNGEWWAPDDIYEHPQYYMGDAGSKAGRETIRAIKDVRGKDTVTIFRSGPDAEFNTGDWVALSREYAREQNLHPTDESKDLPVWSITVPARDVRWAGDDLSEFGYFGPSVSAGVTKVASAGQDCGSAVIAFLTGSPYRNIVDLYGDDGVSWGDLQKRLARYGSLDDFYWPDEDDEQPAKQFLTEHPHWTGVIAITTGGDYHVVAIKDGAPEHWYPDFDQQGVWSAFRFTLGSKTAGILDNGRESSTIVDHGDDQAGLEGRTRRRKGFGNRRAAGRSSEDLSGEASSASRSRQSDVRAMQPRDHVPRQRRSWLRRGSVPVRDVATQAASRIIIRSSGWRDLVESPLWTEAPGVILMDMSGRNRTYEVYVHGKVVARERTVALAQARAEQDLGQCIWRKKAAPEQKADHYYFGWTDEFGAPAVYYAGIPV